MSDANQVRINELARELEVKAKAIIDLLPGYGVTEKKTHSSSIPADVAIATSRSRNSGPAGGAVAGSCQALPKMTADRAPFAAASLS